MMSYWQEGFGSQQFQLSDHARWRLAQRNLSRDDLMLAIRFGRKLHRRGRIIYTLLKADIPSYLQRSCARLTGLTVVMLPDKPLVVTAYRIYGRSYCRLKRQSKRRPKRRQRLQYI